jgi:hypothetical protein
MRPRAQFVGSCGNLGSFFGYFRTRVKGSARLIDSTRRSSLLNAGEEGNVGRSWVVRKLFIFLAAPVALMIMAATG